MGIGIDGAFHAFFFGERPPAPVEIEAAGIGVEFDDRARGGGGIEDGGNIQLVGFAAEEEAAGEVAEHGDMGVFTGANDAVSHLGLRHGEGRVDARHDIIEGGEDFIRKIQRAVLENVALGAGENAEVLVGSIEFRDAGDLGGEACFVEAARLK